MTYDVLGFSTLECGCVLELRQYHWPGAEPEWVTIMYCPRHAHDQEQA